LARFFSGGKMNLSFIGAGKVGTSLGKYFSTHHDITYYSKHFESADKAASFSDGHAVSSLSEALLSEFIFITTQDQYIEDVVDKINESDVDLTGKVILHVSGAHSSLLLNKLMKKGAEVCSLHPLQAFSDIEKSVNDLEKTYFSIEPENNRVIEFLRVFNNPYLLLKPEQKTKYHLSAVVLSNYMVTLMAYGEEILKSIGLENGLEAMKPLVENTLSNIYEKGVQDALTGPINRGDINTLENHMAALDDKEVVMYKQLGQLTTDLLVKDKIIKQHLQDLWRQS
jgi:predicted short-subunit dehydrogenase-like oxidoreductase (DUF2520 family)